MVSSSTNLKSEVVASVIDVDENCRNVYFECKILNQHGTFDYLHSNNTKFSQKNA